MFCYNIDRDRCWCGSMAEQLICNQQVDGSTPFTSSILYGGIPERPKGADCKSVVTDFAGPNPASPTKNKNLVLVARFLFLTERSSNFGQGTCSASALVRILRESMSSLLVNAKREYLRIANTLLPPRPCGEVFHIISAPLLRAFQENFSRIAAYIF